MSILFQQDNARPHVSAATMNYLDQKRVSRLPWPASSPDLNIIENVWSMIDNKLLKLSINNIDDLKKALQTVWLEISNEIIQKLFASLPERIRQVMKNHGYPCSS